MPAPAEDGLSRPSRSAWKGQPTGKPDFHAGVRSARHDGFRFDAAGGKLRNGHVFRTRSFLSTDYFYRVVRYVERNALRANLVERAEQWRWSSLCPDRRETNSEILAAWPLPRPINWIDVVNEPQTEAELEALRHCVQRGTPFRNEDWGATTASRLGLEASLRPRVRPKKATDDLKLSQTS